MNSGIAAILSFFLPGLGQLCQGRPFSAIFIFGLTAVGYMLFVIPGILFHVIAVVDCAWYKQ